MTSLHETIPLITERLVNTFRPERIFLFGSHAWGTPDEDSDLDLLVIVETSEFSPPPRAARAYRCLRDIRYPLDIMVKTREEVETYAHVPAALEYKILPNGRLLYG